MKKKMYNLLYRIRKTNKDVRIDTRKRLVFFDYKNGDTMNEQKIKRLRDEFNFELQSEIRN
ncbi:MAG: hypothetical protein FWF54_03335 [Candidatus Azobacteroides sp.]|nr:hypothetical protein [Candidatus Azobacteroides sp.]